MSTMNTFSGLIFDPMEMTPDDVRLADIAHSLSLICRAAGQIRRFYSVAQHSLNCAAEAAARGWSRRVVLACLLHDASEGYLSDIIRPVKPHLTNYLEIEDTIMQTIWQHFGLGDLSAEEHRQWKQIDDEMLCSELRVLLPGMENCPCVSLASAPDLRERPFRDVEQEFLAAAGQLMQEI